MNKWIFNQIKPFTFFEIIFQNIYNLKANNSAKFFKFDEISTDNNLN